MVTAKTARLPLKTAESLIRLPAAIPMERLAEIRLRSGRRAAAVSVTGQCLPCSETLSRHDIEECFLELCKHSVHSYHNEIVQGYITLDGGCRAGFCGSAVIRDGRIETVRDISSINLRIAHEKRGCANALYSAVFGGGLRSLLLAGAPMSGKTTLLRDLSRLLGERHRVALIDSRSELAAVSGGVPTLDIGENTDVLDCYPRMEGMQLALRTLSPEVMICDEIGGDFEAVEQCISCGVRLIATVHAGSAEELSRRAETARLLRLFDSVAVLGSIGEIAELKIK